MVRQFRPGCVVEQPRQSDLRRRRPQPCSQLGEHRTREDLVLDAPRPPGVDGHSRTFNRKQFTGWFGKGGDVLVDRIINEIGDRLRMEDHAAPTLSAVTVVVMGEDLIAWADCMKPELATSNIMSAHVPVTTGVSCCAGYPARAARSIH